MAQRDTPRKRLVERRAAQTRAEIFQAAIDLFTEHGFEATSMSDVADAVGVSRRTLYRYFATKDDIVFEPPRQWLEVMDRELGTRREGESTRELFHRSLRVVAEFVEDHADEVLRAYAVLVATPELVARHGRSDAEWVQRYLELLGPDVHGREDADLEAMVAATSFVGAQNAAIAVWAMRYPRTPVVEIIDHMLQQVDSLWPDPCRRPR